MKRAGLRIALCLTALILSLLPAASSAQNGRILWQAETGG